MAEIGLKVDNKYTLGIDFGTTNTVVSFMKDNEPFTIPIENNNIFPTVIHFEDDANGTLSKVFGFEAKESSVINPDSTVVSVKTLLSNNKAINVKVNNNTYKFTPKEIVGEILNYIRKQCNEYINNELSLNGIFNSCVITVPANSTDKFKKLMQEAGCLGGFDDDKVHIRLEPTSAAISYARQITTNKKVLVYDFGGGTFDACVLNIKMENDTPNIVVLSTIGHNNLGGNIIDEVVQDFIYEKFKNITNNEIDLFTEDIDEYKRAIVRLKKISTQTKEKLCSSNNTKVSLTPFITTPKRVDLKLNISRNEILEHKRINKLSSDDETFEKYKNKSIKDIVKQTMDITKDCIFKANLKNSDIDEFILVGGSSQMPYISEMVKSTFNKTPYSGIISPALAISYGATIYGDIIYNKKTNIKVLEKTIHSLGIEITGRRYLPIIEEGMEIGEEGIKVMCDTPLTTNYDDISSIAIVVYENTLPKKDKVLQQITEKGINRLSSTTLNGIPKNKKGNEKIQVVFKINKDNILTVEANSLSNKGAKTKLMVDKLY